MSTEGYIKKGGQNNPSPTTSRPDPPKGSYGNRNADLAKKIAARVMTSGNGQKAERLLLWSDSSQRDSGGWSERPLAEYIEKILDEEQRR